MTWKLTAVAALAGLNRDDFSTELSAKNGAAADCQSIPRHYRTMDGDSQEYAEEDEDYSLQIIQQTVSRCDRVVRGIERRV